MLVPTQSQTVTFNFIACTDADVNHYSIIKIGTHIWMAENLKTTKYNDGTSILNVTDDNQWSHLTSGASCYDYIYNWYAIDDSRKICPVGWHVSTNADWTTLVNYLGSSNVAGGKMKETCSNQWSIPNYGATNESGFSGLPISYRADDGSFSSWGDFAEWWTSIRSSASNALTRYLYYGDAGVGYSDFHKTFGFPVRCVKD